jgi:redox-sensitive bicupin YhaK (pirin superfamily)
VARGDIDLNDTRLGPGDGAAVSNETQLTIRAERDAEFLLFDLA